MIFTISPKINKHKFLHSLAPFKDLYLQLDLLFNK